MKKLLIGAVMCMTITCGYVLAMEEMDEPEVTKEERLAAQQALAEATTVAELTKAVKYFNQVYGGGMKTPLNAAAEYGHTELVQELIDQGVDVNEADDKSNRYPALFWAAQNGHAGVVAVLLDAGATVDLALDDGLTPLMAAADSGSTEIVKMLLAAGADRTLKNIFDDTALDIANEEGHHEVVALLKEE